MPFQRGKDQVLALRRNLGPLVDLLIELDRRAGVASRNAAVHPGIASVLELLHHGRQLRGVENFRNTNQHAGIRLGPPANATCASSAAPGPYMR